METLDSNNLVIYFIKSNAKLIWDVIWVLLVHPVPHELFYFQYPDDVNIWASSTDSNTIRWALSYVWLQSCRSRCTGITCSSWGAELTMVLDTKKVLVLGNLMDITHLSLIVTNHEKSIIGANKRINNYNEGSYVFDQQSRFIRGSNFSIPYHMNMSFAHPKEHRFGGN